MDIVNDVISPYFKAQRVTDFRIDTVEIDEAKFYRLPAETQKLIRAYAEFKKSPRDGYIRFEIPIYRWEEIQKSMNVLGGELQGAIEWAETFYPLPRCKHGKALRDGAGDALEPSCGCRNLTAVLARYGKLEGRGKS